MIEFLTPEQEEEMPLYVQKWVDISLSTTKVDRPIAESFANWLYKCIFDKPSVPVIVLDSPYSAWIAVSMLSQIRNQDNSQVLNQVFSQFRDRVQDQVSHRVWEQVRFQVRFQVTFQVRDQVRDQVQDRVRDQVYTQVYTQVWEQVYTQVQEQVKDKIENQDNLLSFIEPYLQGYFWAAFFSYNDYMFEVLKIKNNVLHYNQFKQMIHLGLIYTLDDVCIISDKPKTIQMKNNRLHCDGGPAIKYRDGFVVYALNGVIVDQYLAETPTEQIDPAKISEYTNVEQRREFIRKVGLERIKYKLGAETLDTKILVIEGQSLEYKVLRMNLGGTVCTALEMENPSLPGVWHVEFVPNDCTTFEQAWNFRVDLDPENIDNENGADWYLHGDVVIRPKGEQVFKQYPKWIA